MKKTILIIAMALIGATTFAQHLPTKMTLTLTDKQVLRIDSAINILANREDSKQFTNWFLTSFNPFYEGVKKQIIVDTVKNEKPKSKIKP